MIVKSMGRKSSSSFTDLLTYITRDDAVIKDAKGNPFLIRHNVISKQATGIIKEFENNEANRRFQRKGKNYCYHDIIAFTAADTQKLTSEILEDLARTYIHLRNENSLAIAAIHDDKSHQHIHIMLSGVEAETGKAIRVSKKEYQAIKEKLQEYQIEKYPELVSIVNHAHSLERNQTDKEFQVKAREGISRKEEIKQILANAYEQSYSSKEFYEKITENGLTTYERGGQMGIEDNRNYRLSTLGYDQERLNELEQRFYRIEELESLREQNDREITRDLTAEESQKKENNTT